MYRLGLFLAYERLEVSLVNHKKHLTINDIL